MKNEVYISFEVWILSRAQWLTTMNQWNIPITQKFWLTSGYHSDTGRYSCGLDKRRCGGVVTTSTLNALAFLSRMEQYVPDINVVRVSCKRLPYSSISSYSLSLSFFLLFYTCFIIYTYIFIYYFTCILQYIFMCYRVNTWAYVHLYTLHKRYLTLPKLWSYWL